MDSTILIRMNKWPKDNDRSPESHYRSIVTFKMLKGNSLVSGIIYLKFELIQNIMYVAASLKKYLINSNSEKVRKKQTPKGS